MEKWKDSDLMKRIMSGKLPKQNIEALNSISWLKDTIITNEKKVQENEGEHGLYRFHLSPNTKPRMTQQDRWKKRKCTTQYWAFKDEIIRQAKEQGLAGLPSVIKSIDFYMPMPGSWSKKKQKEMEGKHHTQRPDLDNLLKGLQDALCREDSHIAEISNRLGKYWAYEGLIEIEI